MKKEQISKVLWDIKEEDMADLPVNFLIKRILVYGGFVLICEVLKEYGKEKTQEIFESLKVSEVGIKRHHFFKQYLFS